MILKPCYDFPQPNESILISKTKASVSFQGKVHEVDAEVHLHLLPEARIQVQGNLPKSLGFFGPGNLGNLVIACKDIDGRDIQGVLVRINIRPDGAEFVWHPQNEPIIGLGDQRTKMASIFFHLFNYRQIFGTRQSTEMNGNAIYAIPHVDLKASGWNVELKSLQTNRETFETLQETGGYGLTHVGCLRKEDCSNFNGKTAEDMLNALRHFLSLSKGMWCNPCLAVGFDKKKERVWEAWSSPQGSWAKPMSWFDPHHCDELENLFPGFLSKWENEDWRKALHEVIYWYLSSNYSTLSRGINIDAGIILTQAAIERLSFEYAVRHKRLVEANGFKDLRASDKFRLLFSSLDIPIDIPASMPELKKLAKQFKWIDAPQAITEIRNSLVHPEHKRRGQFGKAFYPAWNLGQWYLELALLRICGYSGTYGNRLIQRWVGEVEPVPWSNNILKHPL
jgi:hypothetical protein